MNFLFFFHSPVHLLFFASFLSLSQSVTHTQGKVFEIGNKRFDHHTIISITYISRMAGDRYINNDNSIDQQQHHHDDEENRHNEQHHDESIKLLPPSTSSSSSSSTDYISDRFESI